MKKFIIILSVILIILGGFLIVKNFISTLKTETSGVVGSIKKTIDSAIDSQISGITNTVQKPRKTPQKQISNPPPLVTKSASPVAPAATLSKLGVLVWTNVQRTLNGNLSSFISNSILDKVADLRLRDMFSRQYFEHISPTGIGASDLAKSNGYDYIAVGENIALGNFGSDQKLVDAWMASPGHRANILNTHYSEIGIATGEGTFDGQKTWLAVQVFGKPLSSCSQIKENLKTQIETNKSAIDNLQNQAQAIRNGLESNTPQTRAEVEIYNQKVEQYNNLIPQINSLISETKNLVDTYNKQVQSFNACLSS